MKRKYQSKILRAIHEDMEGLHKLGIVTDAEMQEFDEDCLVQEPEPAYASSSSSRTEHVTRISAKGAGS
ncbi:MAG: XRE family transcriptional regulator [Treponema sp.]|nr:XRE family transcriptional regulator [Treponema sp.]